MACVGGGPVLLLVVAFAFKLRSHRDGMTGQLATLMIAAVGIQIFLGIVTLLYKVPVSLGVLHQCGAIILLTTVICSWTLYLNPLRFRANS